MNGQGIEMQTVSERRKSEDAPPSQKIADEFNSIFDSYEIPKTREYQFIASSFWGYVSPFETRILVWDFFIIICIYVFLFQLGFILAFTAKVWINLKPIGYNVGLYLILLGAFALDIVVNFHKGYYKVGQGEVITDRKRIMKHYLRSYFAIDLFTIVCVALPLIEDSVWNFFQIVFLVKYLKIKDYEDQILQALEKYPRFCLFYSLLTLLINACLVSHYLSSIFIRMDLELWNIKYYGDDPRFYWLSNNSVYPLDEIDGSWFIQYIYGQNFALGTLSTMAPGPFPRNQIEVIYTNFVMIGLIILSSFLVDGIVKMFYWESEKRAEHQTNIQSFSFFLAKKEVSSKIRHRTQNYFELIWETEGKKDMDAQQSAIEKLSVKLREELLREIIHVEYIEFLGYFGTDRQNLIRELIPGFTECLIEAEEILFEPQEEIQEDTFKMHIVIAGMVQFSIKGPNTKTLPIGFSKFQRVLGVYEFITQQNYLYIAKAVHLTSYYSIQISSFLQAIHKLNLQEQFSELRCRVQIDGDLSLIDKRCLVCLERHRESDCPRIVYTSAAKMDYYEGNMVNSRLKVERGYKRSERGCVGLEREESDPLEFLNNMIMENYIRQVLAGEKFEECENYNTYFSEYNLINLID